MTEFMNGFEQMLSVVIEFSIHLLEFMGVATILVGAVRAVYELFRHNPGVRLKLAESMALALNLSWAARYCARCRCATGARSQSSAR